MSESDRDNVSINHEQTTTLTRFDLTSESSAGASERQERKFSYVKIRHHGDDDLLSESARSKSPDISDAERSKERLLSRTPPVLPQLRNTHRNDFDERIVFYNLRANYASQRNLLRNAQQKWMKSAAVMDQSMAFQLEINDLAHDLRADWDEVEQLDEIVNDYEAKLDNSTRRLNALESGPENHHAENNEGDHISTSQLLKERADPIEPSLSEMKEAKTLSIADEYWIHVSNVRNLSDELFSLGPRPAGVLPGLERNDGGVGGMTPSEYAREHLQLLDELRIERAEVDRLKTLCVEQGYSIDDSDDGDDNGLFKSMVEKLETGPPRIDSLLAERDAKESASAPNTVDPTHLRAGSRIAQWATAVTDSPIPLVPLDMDNGDTEALELVGDVTISHSSPHDSLRYVVPISPPGVLSRRHSAPLITLPKLAPDLPLYSRSDADINFLPVPDIFEALR